MFFLTNTILLTAIFLTINYIALLDMRHKIIWNWSNLLLFILSLMFFVNLIFSPLFLPIDYQTSLTSFVAFSFMSVALFYILGNDQWGGGDAKMIMASSLLLFTIEGLMAYIVILIIGTIVARIITFITKEKTFPYGPTLGVSLLGSLGVSLYVSTASYFYLVISFVFIIIVIMSIILAFTIFKKTFASWEVNIPQDAI